MKLKNYIKRKCRNMILNSDWYNSQFIDCKKFWDGFPMGLDVVNLGSSASVYAFNYEDVDKKCANWAMRPQTLYADFLILQNYCSYLKSGSVVLIPFCPFSSISSPRYLSKEVDRYYTILAGESIRPFDMEKCRKMQDIKNNPKSYYPVKALRKDWMCFFKRQKTCEYFISQGQFEQNAESWVNCWKREFSILDFSHPMRLHNKDMFETGVGIIREMIEFCIEREYKPVIIVPPVTKQLAGKFSLLARDKYLYSFIKEGNVVGIPVLDYFDDERFQKDEWFRDSLFMNEIGAKVFTKKVLEDIQLLGERK